MLMRVRIILMNIMIMCNISNFYQYSPDRPVRLNLEKIASQEGTPKSKRATLMGINKANSPKTALLQKQTFDMEKNESAINAYSKSKLYL